MHPNLRIAVVGAGAIGCTLVARLVSAGHNVKLLARGETLACVRRDGISLDRKSVV